MFFNYFGTFFGTKFNNSPIQSLIILWINQLVFLIGKSTFKFKKVWSSFKSNNTIGKDLSMLIWQSLWPVALGYQCSLSHALNKVLGDWSTVTVRVWGKIVTGPMRGLGEKCLFGWVARFEILCDNQQVLMLYTHEK